MRRIPNGCRGRGAGHSLGSNFGITQSFRVPVPNPVTLDGVSLLLNGIAAPLNFVGPNQINFQVPWELQGQSSMSAVVIANGVQTAPQTFSLNTFAPGIFTVNQNGQAAALLAGTNTIACNPLTLPYCGGLASPVVRGNAIEVYMTGLGPVTNQPASGAPPSPSAPQSVTLTQPTATVGGVSAPVLFSGLPEFYLGLYQVNVQVPADAPTGDAVPVVVTQGGVASNTATIAVK